MTDVKPHTRQHNVPSYYQQYQADGYFVIPQCLHGDGLQTLMNEVKRIHDLWMRQNQSDYQQYGMVNMHSLTASTYFSDGQYPERDRGRFFNMLIPEKLLAIMEGMFGNELYFHNTQLFFNPYQHSRKPYWHRDFQYSGDTEVAQQDDLDSMLSLHIRIPLIAETGIELIPGTHKRWDTAHEREVRLQSNGHESHQALPDSRLIALEAGDALIFSANMIHRGHYCQPERLALDICVGNPHPKTIKYIDNKNLPQDSEMQYIEHSQWFAKAKKISQ
ncbi:phytanoyl-CoA dioxygenase family protein [Thalassotalea litorea]|uniref:phytanoyl-CoA dioxygenase family protein n=1 Tax=Thalassotalea litorea TaxID=2020715 RepID=UPI003735CDE0